MKPLKHLLPLILISSALLLSIGARKRKSGLRPDPPIADKPETVSENSTANTEQNQIVNNPPRDEVQSIEPIRDDHHTHSHEQQHNVRERTKLVIEILTFIALVAYTVYTAQMLRQMRGSVKQAKRAANIADATQKSIEANSQLDQRAWIGIKSIVFTEYSKAKEVQAEIIMANNGKTPGLKVIVKKGHGPRLPTKKYLDETKITGPSAVLAISPTADFRIVELIGGTISEPLYVYGVIAYRDIFQNTPVHRTYFCIFIANGIIQRWISVRL